MPGEKRSTREEPAEMETDDTAGDRAARRARLALVEHIVLQLHSVTETDVDDDPTVDPVLALREQDWVNHDHDDGNFDPRKIRKRLNK